MSGMLDEYIDKLGTYFVYFNVRENYGITFERFMNLVKNGQWEVMVSAGSSKR